VDLQIDLLLHLEAFKVVLMVLLLLLLSQQRQPALLKWQF